MGSSTLSVMIVDRQSFYRLGVSQVIAGDSGFQISDYSPDDDLVNIIEESTPDVLLIGIDPPSLSGLKLGSTIIRRFPSIRLIMLSPNPNDDELFETIRSGAVAYLDKNSTAEEIVRIIRHAANGEYPINDSLLAKPQVAGNVLKSFQEIVSMGKPMETVTAPLTNRETQILNHIADGNSNKQIAGKLNISEQTIKNHVSSILRKLNANDRAHAVMLAIRHGWISLDDHE
jgi:DNA-binding NarL/FixJ family response regulator